MTAVAGRPRITIGLAAVILLAGCSTAAPGGSPAESHATAPSADAMASAPPGASGGASPPGGGTLTSDALHGVELYDVTAEATFTLGQLAAEEPVLLETMAIWCTNCRAQQGEVRAAHEQVAFTSVSLDVDPNERPGDLAAYADELGFGWRFAMANHTLASELRDRFGPAVLNPPSTPMILLFPDGSIRALEFRAYSASELAAEIAAG